MLPVRSGHCNWKHYWVDCAFDYAKRAPDHRCIEVKVCICTHTRERGVNERSPHFKNKLGIRRRKQTSLESPFQHQNYIRPTCETQQNNLLILPHSFSWAIKANDQQVNTTTKADSTLRISALRKIVRHSIGIGLVCRGV